MSYRPQTIAEAARAALAVMEKGGERRVNALGVAALLVWMQAELAHDSVDNTVELMRHFLDSLQRSGGVKA